MDTKIKIFKNPQFGNIRIVTNEQGEPLFCLADVCKAVGLSNPSSVKTRLDECDVQLVDLHALNYTEGGTGNTMTNFITESGFYDVLLQSSSLSVKPFRKWVTSEVLPSIRKYGMYATDNVLSNPETLLEAMQALNRERKKSGDLEIIIKGLKTQNKMLNSSNSTMITKIEKQRKLLENKEVNSNAKIAERFFMVVDMLVSAKVMRGKQTFTTMYEINNRNFGFSKKYPERKLFQPIWISYLMEDFGISAEWIMTGKGKMFSKDVKVNIVN